MTLTTKQQAWDQFIGRINKPTSNPRADAHRVPLADPRERGVSTTIPSNRRISASRCPDCPHVWKKHKMTGTCRKSCGCPNGSYRREH